MVRAAGPRTRRGAVLVLVATLAGALLLAGCGSDPEDTLSVAEGEPMRLGDLVYNVQISRFLNPEDDEDKNYLAGHPPPSRNEFYLGVFMEISNEADSVQRVPTQFLVVDTQGTEFEPLPSQNPFALRLGGKVAANGELPEPESAAANGPIQGAMVLFLVDRAAALEERPLVLHIPSSTGEVGDVELDI
jgi:hypothetical protein